MLIPRRGSPRARQDDAAVGAILDKLKDRKVTAAELAELRKTIEGPSTTLDESLTRSTRASKESVAPAQRMRPPATQAPANPPPKGQSRTIDARLSQVRSPYDHRPSSAASEPARCRGPSSEGAEQQYSDSRVGTPAKGTGSRPSGWGRWPDGRVFEATVTVKVLKDVETCRQGPPTSTRSSR